jgi:hypothetical protein
MHLKGNVGYVITASTTAVAGIKSWTLDRSIDMLDTTDFGSSGDKEYIAGLKGWAGTFEGLKDGAPLGLGTTVSLALYESSAGGQVWSGTAYLNNQTINTPVDGLVSYTYSYQGTGSITIATS